MVTAAVEAELFVVEAVDAVVADTENVGGAIWDLGKHLAGAALRTRGGR